jgi:hypothetical protein
MSRLWSILISLLSWVGRIRIPIPRWRKTDVLVGDPSALDALGSTRWKDFTTAERLFDVWAPLPGSVWEPFHCATLFAALDRIPPQRLGPLEEVAVPPWLRGELPAPSWLDRETWLIVDAPPVLSIAVAAQVASLRLAQPVCTFDNWPNPLGLVRPERALAALLHFAPWLEHARHGWTADLPPMWICDGERLGWNPGQPGEFDNRYFLDDSILPGPAVLMQAGIRKLVYATLGSVESPPSRVAEDQTAGPAPAPQVQSGLKVSPDLTAYLAELRRAGIDVQGLALGSLDRWRLGPVPLELVTKPLDQINRGSFFRSSAGGFGAPIPEPSSSSG